MIKVRLGLTTTARINASTPLTARNAANTNSNNKFLATTASRKQNYEWIQKSLAL